MTSVLLAQADSVANWLSAFSTFAAVFAALGIAIWDVRRAAAERRDREAAQARLVTATRSGPRRVDITNHSQSPVHQPRVESVGDRVPVSWMFSPLTDLYAQVLPPNTTHRVGIDVLEGEYRWVFDKPVDLGDVIITFTDAAGLRWRRSGNGEPERVL